MKLSKFKTILSTQKELKFKLPSGDLVPNHFHVTEVGQIDKRFIDCGGVIRHESTVNFQLWEANDYDHRLHPEKLINIIELSEKSLNIQDNEIEVEYQGATISKFGLEFEDNHFVLSTKFTDCLAKDNCGVPEEKTKLAMADISKDVENACVPGSGCC